MRIGLIARSDNRGLGLQSLEFYRHMEPARVLLVDMGPLTPYAQHPERYPDARVSSWVGGKLEPEAITWLLDGCDIVWSAETVYDEDVILEARKRGIKVVIAPNYEFAGWSRYPEMARPDLFLCPSLWHFDDLPEPKMHLPFPVARDRLPFRCRTEGRTFLHVAGHRAMQDRAGTRLVRAALRLVREPIQVIVRSQSPITQWTSRGPVEISTRYGDIDNYWELYEGDVLLAPRRYGGQSLPLNEASSCGMPVVALDRSPEREILSPELLIKARRSRDLRCQPGFVGWYDTDPRAVARKIDELAARPIADLSVEADAYAESISWETLRPRYLEVFEQLCSVAA